MTNEDILSLIDTQFSIEQQRKLAAELAYKFPDVASKGVEKRLLENKVVHRPLTPAGAIRIIARAYGFTAKQVLSRDKSPKYGRARQAIALILRSPLFGLKLQQISAALERDDHTTTRYYLEKPIPSDDPTFWRAVQGIARILDIHEDEARNFFSEQGTRRPRSRRASAQRVC